MCNKFAEWEALFDNYIEIEKNCISNINSINEIHINLNKLVGRQREDDLHFYNSIIENTNHFLNGSIKIRKIKFKKDLNYIWNLVNKTSEVNNFNTGEVNKSKFSHLIKDFTKLYSEINLTQKNNTPLTWVKNDSIQNFKEIELEMDQVMLYHIKLITSFFKLTDLEITFYCNISRTNY